MSDLKKYDDLSKHVCFLRVDNPAFVQFCEMVDEISQLKERIAELERERDEQRGVSDE